jgi:hypothetical protein
MTCDKGFTIGCVCYSAGGGGLCLHSRYCFCMGVERVGGALAMVIFLLQPLKLWGFLVHGQGCNLATRIFVLVVRDSSVSIVTSYGLDGPGIESQWGRIFRTRLPGLSRG